MDVSFGCVIISIGSFYNRLYRTKRMKFVILFFSLALSHNVDGESSHGPNLKDLLDSLDKGSSIIFMAQILFVLESTDMNARTSYLEPEALILNGVWDPVKSQQSIQEMENKAQAQFYNGLFHDFLLFIQSSFRVAVNVQPRSFDRLLT